MFDSIKINNLRALKDHVLVADMNFKGRTTSTGIQLLSDDGRTAGVRPRWAQIYAVGPKQTELQVGQWILVSHGRWTRGVSVEDSTGEHVIRRVDANDVMLVSEVEPGDDGLSTAVLVDSKTHW
jgi:hypothetical protein